MVIAKLAGGGEERLRASLIEFESPEVADRAMTLSDSLLAGRPSASRGQPAAAATACWRGYPPNDAQAFRRDEGEVRRFPSATALI